MRRLIFQKWCNDVTSGIRTHPDRENASKELAHHLEDKYQALIAQGYGPQEAADKAVADMGDPLELSLQLAAAHPPIWGKVYTFTKWALVVCLVVTALMYLIFFTLTRYVITTYKDFDPTIVQLGGDEYQLEVYDAGATDISDGYLLRASDASLWLVETENSRGEIFRNHYFNVRIDSYTYLPWAETPNFSEWMWAVDSLGNYYYSEQEDSMAQESSIDAKDYHTGMFTYTHNLWLRPYVSQEAEWIEIHYDRSGRDIVLRIDLTGGEKP